MLSSPGRLNVTLPEDRRTLVIVDDEQRVVEALGREIGHIYGSGVYNVQGFTDPSSCVTYVREHARSVFLVLSDLRMPQMNGSALVREVREISPDTQTVLLTAYPDIPDIQQAVSASIQGLMMKPWSREALKLEIDKAAETVALRTENRRLEQELEGQLRLAGEFQQALLATDTHVSDRLDIDILYRPIERTRCGGDYYEVIRLAEHVAAVVLGDVAGHGFRAALVTGALKTMIRSYMLANEGHLDDPSSLLTYLNAELCRLLALAPGVVVALTVVVLVPLSGQARLAIAGQPPVFRVRPDGGVWFWTENPALGFVDGVDFETRQIEIQPGDRIALFTDGLVESVRQGQRLRWEEAEAIIRAGRGQPAAQTVDAFSRALHAERFSDDVTFLAIDVR
jgi:sigma-B regulation protein RsbU (phosphoserine phosphatase)